MARVLKVFFHDACFDGTTSAALFSAFYRDAFDKDVEVQPIGMVHRDGNPFENVPLDADDHACVDFRFCADLRMKWWFDHHPTAFQPPALRDVFDSAHLPTWYFDPTAPSCAGLIARQLAAHHAWTPPARLLEVVTWADKIDAAKFASAEDANALAEPAQRIAAWLAHGRTKQDTATYVERLSRGSLEEVSAWLAPDLDKIADARAMEEGAVQRLGVWHGQVVVFDRLSEVGARSPGFLGYQLFPACAYAVSATRSTEGIKISVGVNPWSKHPRTHDIGELCARFGGGGHAVVGGVTLGPSELERARVAMHEIVRELEAT